MRVFPLTVALPGTVLVEELELDLEELELDLEELELDELDLFELEELEELDELDELEEFELEELELEVFSRTGVALLGSRPSAACLARYLSTM